MQTLHNFSETLAERECGHDSRLDLTPRKDAFRQACATTNSEPLTSATQELAAKALTFALSYGGISGEVWVTWGNPIQVTTTDRTFELPLHLSPEAGALKPRLALTFDGGELRLLEDAMSVLEIEGRNAINQMKAANELMALGASEEEMVMLEDWASSIRMTS